MPNFREQLREAIEENGGYHRGGYGRGDDYDLAWNVKMYRMPNLDNVLKACAENHFISEGDMVMRHPNIREKACKLMEKEDGVCRWAQESMCELLSNDDAYKMLSPESAAKYGYTDDGTPFDMKFGFAGRSGGYIVIEEFEGRKGGSLLDYLDADEIKEEDAYEEAWAQRLLCCIAECEKMFSDASVYAEFEYEIGFQLGNALEQETEEEDA